MFRAEALTRLSVVAGALLIAGCAATAPGTREAGTVTVVTGGGSYDIQRGADIRVDPSVAIGADRAWAALPTVYEEIGVPTDAFDPTSMQIGTGRYRFSRSFLDRPTSDYFDCGLDPGLNRPLADQVPIDARVVTTVLSDGAAGSRIRTVVEGSARRTGGNAGTAACRSTGMLERVIARMVEAHAVR